MLSAVVFDLGGVLERVGPVTDWLAPWQAGLARSPAGLDGAIERAVPTSDIETGQISEPAYRARIAAALGLTPAQEERFFADMWAWYCGEPDAELETYAASLRPRCRTAILSNSADGARREEHARYRFADRFDPVIYSHEAGVAKPDPRSYQLVCRALGLPPGQVAMVDDVPEFVAGARAAGMAAVHHRSARQTAGQLDALLR